MTLTLSPGPLPARIDNDVSNVAFSQKNNLSGRHFSSNILISLTGRLHHSLRRTADGFLWSSANASVNAEDL